MKINSFKGAYAFLSNFQVINITIEGKIWKTSEHLYMAYKTLDPTIQEHIRCINTPGQVKRYARTIELRPDWEEVKVSVMLKCIQYKFTLNNIMKENLLGTGNVELIEGNYWHDNFWGNCKCLKCKNKLGQNYLGKLLMRVRKDIKK